jgi:hypothetical protein
MPCDINQYINNQNHPFFLDRAKVWESDKTKIIQSSTGATKTDGLTNEEAACYASYMLSNTRAQLDSKLNDIYQPSTSVSSTFDSNYHATMLTGVVWAALGTTVLYYAFTKI